MAPAPKMAPYKKYQCRYYDAETGRPLSPSCGLGSYCRFVHPDDPNWPGLKCRPPLPRPKGSSGFQSVWHHDDNRNRPRRSPSPAPPIRRSPLVSQKDHFMRCKVEPDTNDLPFRFDDDEGDTDRENFAPHRYHNISEPRSRRSAVEPKSPRERSIAVLQNTLVSDVRDRLSTEYMRLIEAFLLSQDKTRARADRLDESQTSITLSVASQAEATKTRSEQFISLFKDVAMYAVMFSSQIIQDTVLHNQEERKLQTFNEISTTLSKISASSAGVVAGPIADIILAHTKSKERLDVNFRQLGAAWENVFGTLMAEFSLNLENKLQAALTSVKNEADNVLHQLKRRRESLSPERKWQDGGAGKENDRNGTFASSSSYASTRDNKRRKIASQSCSPAPSEIRQTRDRPVRRSAVVKISLDDILSQMKTKIDQQSTSLSMLSKENEEASSFVLGYFLFQFPTRR
ncbi:hypothetical protein D9757_001911 [Collybiopsis confluens]|uniref:C3H1-type domain-containing protein n=1 Tax=Collybiopsis confluens TaxID=2823264 RepID=A0A8H5HXI9_9AGAR|nr:hypothetical protein D9757_001911 [Collybiopsis confluens]